MSDTTYNGWTNYATWRVQLEIVSDLVENQDERTYADMETYDCAQQLESEVDDIVSGFGEVSEGLALDYARAFLSDVNWYELAEHAIENNAERFPSEKCDDCDEELDSDGDCINEPCTNYYAREDIDA